ncbi:MAG: hypothetical protein IJP68_03745, partial [Selenomonadaceae bacterium]|nr:hypothetical protein [Selenomonadaceae bacterium]
NFVNDDAQKWFETCLELVPETYRELSFSATGLHIIAKPTVDKFPHVSNGKDGVLWFDREKNIKLEIFYKNQARYCLLTGKPFRGFIDKVASGEEVDRLLEKILDEIKRRQEPAPARTEIVSKSDKLLQAAQIDNLDYDLFRAERMLNEINAADLNDTDGLAVISAAKNIGVPYSVIDAWNRSDAKRYHEVENQKRYDSLTDSSFNIETLHGIAKRFHYSEKDSTREWFKLHPELSTKAIFNSKVRGEKVKKTAPCKKLKSYKMTAPYS